MIIHNEHLNKIYRHISVNNFRYGHKIRYSLDRDGRIYMTMHRKHTMNKSLLIEISDENMRIIT